MRKRIAATGLALVFLLGAGSVAELSIAQAAPLNKKLTTAQWWHKYKYDVARMQKAVTTFTTLATRYDSETGPEATPQVLFRKMKASVKSLTKDYTAVNGLLPLPGFTQWKTLKATTHAMILVGQDVKLTLKNPHVRYFGTDYFANKSDWEVLGKFLTKHGLVMPH